MEELPTIFTAVKDNGAIDVTLEEAKEGGDNIMELQADNMRNTEYKTAAKCHQATQTELLTLLKKGDIAIDELKIQNYDSVSKFINVRKKTIIAH